MKDKNLYFVGGIVRDEILGISSFDTDYCYEGNAIEFAKKQGLNIIRENPDFGTVKVLFNNKEIDIASTRKETYPQKGHLPNVSEIGCSLEEDLKRRDFTINALAKRTTDGKIIDIYNGLDDIKNKKLRILHDNSFIDDPTRILRGLKFSIRFNFELENNTMILQEKYLQNINYDMSYHRLKKELKETFNLNKKEAFEKFISQNIFKLLGNNQKKYKLSKNIENILQDYNDPWLMYLGGFDLTNFELTRNEKKILKWYNDLLSGKKVTNNTPKESIILTQIIEKYD